VFEHLRLAEPLRDSTGDHTVTLRLIAASDERRWAAVRLANAQWLTPWEATSPVPAPTVSFRSYTREIRRLHRDGDALPLVIEYDGEFVGQVSVSGVQRGSLLTAAAGYWIAQDVAGRGITPLAVAMACDHCWFTWGLHRIEINIRPENAASLRVVQKLGFRDEGLRRAYMHIAGQWADHRTFALTAPEVPGGLVRRLRERAL